MSLNKKYWFLYFHSYRNFKINLISNKSKIVTNLAVEDNIKDTLRQVINLILIETITRP